MEPLYNIYYAGELLEGQQLAQVRAKLAALFKADDATLDKLFSGAPQLVKRDCDKATALKYKQAMEKAGAKPLIKSAQPAAEAAPTKPQTAAERIAALAAAPDVASSQGPAVATPQVATPNPAEDDSELDLAPEGTDVLMPDERSEQVVADIDTSALDVDTLAERLSEAPPPPPAAPDTSHLSMGEVGESIPTLSDDAEVIELNTDGLDLAPAGTDFSDCATPEAEAPALDLSGIDLAPAGSDVLAEEHRNRPKPPPPATDHISLQD